MDGVSALLKQISPSPITCSCVGGSLQLFPGFFGMCVWGGIHHFLGFCDMQYVYVPIVPLLFCVWYELNVGVPAWVRGRWG